MAGLTQALVASLAIAAVSTLGDFIWATWIPQQRALYGLLHGALLFLAIGSVLGALAGRVTAGAISGLLLGFAAAGAFYLIFPLAGFAAMFVAWTGVWVGLAVTYARLRGVLLREPSVVSRGTIAALGSGLGFYLISGIWRPFDPPGLDYLVHFGAWTIAYAPGFGALLIAKR